MIPVKISITGDYSKGQDFIGFAKSQMAILEREMSFQKLNEGHRTVRPFDGVVIECWSSFSLQVIHIYVESKGVSKALKDVVEPVNIKCSDIPLIVTGKIGLSIKKRTCYIDVSKLGVSSPFKSWGPLTDHFTDASVSFIQVRYPKETVTFGSAVKHLTFMISIAGKLGSTSVRVVASEEFTRPEDKRPDFSAIDDDTLDFVPEKKNITSCIKVHKSEIVITKENVSANFSADKTRLYIVSWNSGQQVVDLTVTSETVVSYGSYAIYSRSLVDGVITWTEDVSGTISAPGAMVGVFVSPDGYIHGLYRYRPVLKTTEELCAYEQGETFYFPESYCPGRTPGYASWGELFNATSPIAYKINLESLSGGTNVLTLGDLIEETLISLGTCISDGVLYGGYFPITSVPEIKTEISGSGELLLQDTDPYFAWYLANNPFSGKIWDIFNTADYPDNDLPNFVPTASYVSDSSTSHVYWYTWARTKVLALAEPISVVARPVQLFGNTYVSQTRQYTEGTNYDSWNGSSYTDHHAEVTAILYPPHVLSSKFGRTISVSETKEEYYANTNWTIDWSTNVFFLLENKTGEAILAPASVLYPLNIQNAVGTSSFHAYDNDEALSIVGVKYQDITDPDNPVDNQWLIEMNGVDITTAVLTESGFSQSELHYVGFLF